MLEKSIEKIFEKVLKVRYDKKCTSFKDMEKKLFEMEFFLKDMDHVTG